VHDGVVDELGLRSARFVPHAASAEIPIVTRKGSVTPALSTWTGRGFQLPERASIPVVGPHGVLGHIAIDSTPGRSVSIDERRIAVALADVLAVALQRSPDQSGRIT
jgi:hypothetical protein